jgi:hypothetical protein
MNDAERLMTYIIINAWNQKKCWTNFKALWRDFDSRVWFGERLYIIIRNTLNGKYVRVCQYYRKTVLQRDWGD